MWPDFTRISAQRQRSTTRDRTRFTAALFNDSARYPGNLAAQGQRRIIFQTPLQAV